MQAKVRFSKKNTTFTCITDLRPTLGACYEGKSEGCPNKTWLLPAKQTRDMVLMQVQPIFISSDFLISIWHDLATDFCARTRKSEWAASSHFSSHLSFFFTFCSHSFPPRRLLFLLFPNGLRLIKPVLITIQASSHRILQDSKSPRLEVPRRDARSVNN